MFGGFIGTTAQSDSSRACVSALRLSPSRTGLDSLAAETPWRSPGSRTCCFSTCLGSATTPGPASARDLSPPAGVAFSLTGKDRHPDLSFSRLNTQPDDASVYASPTASQRPAQDSRSGRSRYSFPVGLFHPLQHAGLSRRTQSSTLPRFPAQSRNSAGLAKRCNTRLAKGMRAIQYSGPTGLSRRTRSLTLPRAANVHLRARFVPLPDTRCPPG